MNCFVENCDNNLSKFDSTVHGDCVLQHLTIIKREIDKILSHFSVLKENYEEVTQERDKWKKKYKELKVKLSKRSPSFDSPKRARTEPFNSTLNSPKLFKSLIKRRPSFGKENSPSKKASKSPSKMSVALSFSKLGEDFTNLTKTSSPKNLKQQNLKQSFEKSKVKRVQQTDVDATFCEVLEKKPKWMSKAKLDNSVEVAKKKKTSPNQKTDKQKEKSELFAFQQPASKVLLTETEKNDKVVEKLEETPNTSQIIPPHKIKEEKLSESDLDIFGSDGESSRGSSVMFVEQPANQPIVIPDQTVQPEDPLLASLERNFLERTEYDDSLPIPKPTRKRKQFYGECRDCQEFYDKFASVNGPTQADTFIRKCPNNCKAWAYRVSEAQPKQARIPLPPPRFDTPSGLWDMPFTSEDPDKTQDGL